jgi:DNA-binding phage protein
MSTDDIKTVLCEMLRAKKITQSELARRLGWPRQQLHKLLKQPGDMHLSTLIKILDAAGAKLKIQ